MSKNLSRESVTYRVKLKPEKERKSEPVRLGTLFPAVLRDIEKRIQKNKREK